MNIDFSPDASDYDKAWSGQKLCFTQHRAWGEVKSSTYKPDFMLINGNAMAVHIRSLPVIKGNYGYSPRAFHDHNLPDATGLARISSEICRHFNLTHLIIEPDVVEADHSRIDDYLSAGFAISEETIQPRHSRLIDLTKSDEELKGDMTKDVRRRITRGENEGYKFKENTSPQGLDEFYSDLSEVAKRAKFGIQPKSYFERILQNFPSEIVHIYLTYDKNDQLLYGMFTLNDGEAFRRIYGGPALAGRQGDAAQFAGWQVIKAAQALGAKTMDMWGVAPYDSEGNFVDGHPLSGVSKFKATLGGENVTYLPQLIWVRDRARFTAYRQLTRTYRGLKKFKRMLG